MEVHVTGNAAALAEANDFKRFKVVMSDRPAAGFASLGADLRSALTFDDADTAWVSCTWLRAAGPADPDWLARFELMLDKARPMGWVSADGAAIRAHVEWPLAAGDSPAVGDAFRKAMRRLAATPCLVTTLRDGRRHGMAATSVTSLCFEPPSILVCVNTGASIHDPLDAEGRFCANLMGGAHSDLLGAFSGELKGEARFSLGDWREEGGLPYLADAQANIFCSVAERWRYGTHSIFVGQVEAVRADAELDPMVYLDGRKGRFATA
ncbi:hypothetical protein GLS40_08995 [Pseudooceanicola sp. 216_PA32_1]|uniref:Flavin reductase like domain-containing protein n=1 Tax=Pseudooceanicola pacificus TaxID=2676438 RepID=A0A844WBG2_9RHOB|nr:flavin reductase family protein [Pseudooceanicola pacificus]MWB78158.1 hypothetical protein [Pseudooceanicola pacificus]